MDDKNKLYFGDNLKILREYVPDASVDLIYLDPPFNSSATYNVLFKEKSGEESAITGIACCSLNMFQGWLVCACSVYL
jgi:16S rRNA G966 N2-methylase RsmD